MATQNQKNPKTEPVRKTTINKAFDSDANDGLTADEHAEDMLRKSPRLSGLDRRGSSTTDNQEDPSSGRTYLH